MRRTAARLERTLGPFPDRALVHGVAFDGTSVWIACGARVHAVDPGSGAVTRTLDVPGDAGTAFDGTFLYQLASDRIQKLDPRSGEVVATVPCPAGASGLAWAEGLLWVGRYADRRIDQVDPETGAVVRTLVSDRFVTGVTWAEGATGEAELWHGTAGGDAATLRRIDPRSGRLLEVVTLPAGAPVSGLAADATRFFCGGAAEGTVRVVRRPSRTRR